MKFEAILFSICLLFSTACSSAGSSSISNAQRSLQGVQLKVDKRISLVTEKSGVSKKIDETEIEGRGNLSAIYFLDETRGWIGGNGKLYKTDDGGKSWQQIKIEASESAYVKDIFFVSPIEGWIILQKSSPLAIDYQENHFWLMHTGDGGQSWKLQYEGETAEVTDLSFTDARNGWLTGIKYVGLRPFRYTYLILRTIDQGEHWIEVSDELKSITADRKKASPDGINAGIMGISTSDMLSATIITSERGIFKTFNGGKNWQPIGMIQSELVQTSIRSFGMKDNNRLWVASSADGEEGVWGALLVEQSDTSWIRYALPGFYLADILHLSGKQFLACGYIVHYKGRNAGTKEGVVLYSSDEGENWSIIYRSNRVKSINALAAISLDHIWAIGESGLVIRFESK